MGRFWPICLGAALLILCGADSRADGYMQVPGIIHMDSAVSGGALTFDELADAAIAAGAEFAIVTDHDTQAVTFGLPPLRSILKLTYRRPSIRTYGARRYLDDIAAVNATRPGLLFMPGVEAVPFYAWERTGGRMTLRDFHRHLLVLGLDSPAALDALPSLETGYPRRITPRSLLALLWAVPLIWALVFLLRPGIHGRLRRYRLIGGIPVLVVSAAFLANGWPYSTASIDQYHGDAGAVPYQAVIDYTNNAGGLTFWAHPEAAFSETIPGGEDSTPILDIAARLAGGGITLETAPYTHLLNGATGYAGFAIFNEGRETMGVPGGVWDSLLKQYCRGARERPVWAIAELDLESRGDAGSAGDCMTVALASERSSAAILDALRQGRMYCFAASYSRKVRVAEYAVIAGDRRAGSGETLDMANAPGGTGAARLALDLDITPGTREIDIVVIRDGEVIARERLNGSARLEIPLPAAQGKSYVRVAGYDRDGMQIALNPIFFTGSAQ